MSPRPILTTEELATELGVDAKTVRRYRVDVPSFAACVLHETPRSTVWSRELLIRAGWLTSPPPVLVAPQPVGAAS